MPGEDTEQHDYSGRRRGMSCLIEQSVAKTANSGERTPQMTSACWPEVGRIERLFEPGDQMWHLHHPTHSCCLSPRECHRLAVSLGGRPPQYLSGVHPS